MAKTSKGVILSQASQIKSDYSFALIKATADNKSLVQDASSAELKVNALVEYSKDSQWDPKKLTSLGFPAGCFLIVDLRGQDIHAADLITNLALVRQYGYQAGVIDDLSTLDDIKALKANQIYLINSGKTNDDQDASLNGNEITDGSGKLAVGMSVKWQRDYTNVDVSGDHAGFVGMGQDTLLKGGNAFGYSTNGRDFNAVITPKGLIFRRPDAERMWRLLKPNEIADINSTVGDKVKKEVDSATAEIPAAVSAANSAVSAAESAIAASKVNSDAIVAQSAAVVEAKSAMDSATAEIQQTAANAASDAAKIRADVARVQNEVDTAKTANSASVEALKSDIDTAKQDLADVHDSLDKAQSAIEQNQKLINDSVAKITSDVSATKQDLADVHDSLTKAQAAAEQNQKAIDKSIAQINDSVDATNQDLADVRKDLTKAQSDITANQKAIDDNVAQISDDITQDRKDIADVRQGLTKAQSDITANQKAVNDNVAQINSNIEQDRKDIASAQQANADTAKQLDTYSKQATEQGKTIKTIQDKQDGFTATLADVQGNVSQVSDKVDGLSASLKDTQGNVASVKAQADQLSATLTNHGKSIATLTASAKELSSTLEDADGRLSKVEQTAQTNSSTLSDVQGDLSQVKQDATTLTSTLKDAQGNISTLQQKADSVSAQLASAQGDIATLQTGVDSVKAMLTSHDKSIHTLQADSKSLKDSMADAQGDISTLRKTATDVTSELEDHTGRLSKVEQTASKQATTLSDLQGNLSQVEQKADSNTTTISSINKNAMQDRGVITDTKTSFDSLTQLGTYSIKAISLPKMPEQHYGTLAVSGSAGSGWISQQFVADTTGNVYTRVFSNNAWSAWKQGGSQDAINQVKQTADSNSATIRNVQGDVSTLKQTAAGVEAALADHEGDIHTLQADDKSLKDSMADAQGDISTLSKTATSLDSEMKDHAGRLSKVEQSATTQATTLSDLQGNLSQVKQQADGLVTTLKNAQGSIMQIQQKADGTLAQLKSAQGDIASLQTNITGIKATLVSHEGDIHTLQADSRMLKDDMKDAQGNISSLQKSSTKLDSEMSSQDGRLSKVEQTATEHSTTISDLGKKVDSNGGGVNLLTNSQGPFRPTQKISSATVSDNYDVYNSDVYMVQGQTYTVSGQTNGTWSGTHDTEHVSDNCVLWLTDNSNVSQIISADTMPHTFTWPYPTKSYHLRVNAYHHGADNPIYAEKVKIERGSVATPYSPAPEDLATVTQVKQTADGIENTLKSAQGDIDQIKQTAKGTSEQLSNVQGDVTNIQKDVNGLKQTTADNAGNIHTLQSDSKALQDDMKDAKGNISSLQKTSTSLVSEFRDHDGRLSKVEQTATEHTSELADTKGNIDKVTQKANTLQLLLSDAQKNINNIKIDAQGLHQTLTGQSNQLANLNVTLNNLDSKYSGITGDLQSKQTALSTEQQQTKDVLLRKADKSEVDNVKGTVNQVSAEQKTMADQINQKVSSTEYQTLKDKINGLRIGGRNLLSNSDKDIVIESKTTDPWPAWCNKAIYWDLTPGETYTFSVSATNTNNVQEASMRIWNSSSNKEVGNANFVFPADSKRHSKTFTIPKDGTSYSVWLYAGHMGKIEGKNFVTTYHHPQLEMGNVESDYSPNPDDAIASIKKNSTAIDENSKLISLMAKQTDVDNIKGTAQQLSARLDVMAGEVKSKVDETKVNNIVDGKGYATTSTVQSLVDQKAGTINESITKLDSKIDESGGGINLQGGTADCSLPIGSNGPRITIENYDDHTKMIHAVGSKSGFYIGYDKGRFIPEVGETYTFSADIKGKGTINGNLFKYEGADRSSMGSITLNNNWQRIKTTVHVSQLSGTWIIYPNPDNGNNDFYVKNIKIERGSIATPYSQAPSDNASVSQLQSVTASIDGLQSRVTNYQNDTSSKYTQLSSLMQSKVNQGDLSSVRTQLANAINDRVGKGELMSQINLQAGNTLIQTGKLYLDSSSVVFSGRAFIPSAAISELDADKLTFYGNGSKASIGAGIAQYDQDAIKSTINLQYQGGFEIHSSNQLGSILTMHDNTVRLAVKSNGMANPNSPTDQYSGFYASTSYSLMNSYLKDGTTSGISIGSTDSGVNKDYRIHVYDGSNASNNLSKGISISTSSRFDVYAGNSQLFLGPDKAELRGNDHATVHGNDHTFIEGGNEQIYIHDGEVCIGMPGHESDKTSVHLRVFGWADFNGWMNVMGLSQTSLLSTKTRIEPLDTREALDKIMAANVETYQFKSDVAEGKTKRHASVIIDDVHDISQYYTPEEFISENRKGRDDGDIVGYLMGAVQELKKQLDKVKEKINYE